jgi:hypothetical protein
MLSRDLSIGQSQLAKLKTEDSRIVSSKPELLSEIERFYRQLYRSTRRPEVGLTEDPRARLTRHHTDDIRRTRLLVMALKQPKNSKAPGKYGITAELLTPDS